MRHQKVTVKYTVRAVHYGDYECAACRRMNRVALKLARPLRGRLLYAFRHFPLVGVHPHALRAAEAAEA